MDQELHEEEEEDTNAGTLEQERPSLLPAFGDTIVPVGGTLMFCQEVPTHQLIQGKIGRASCRERVSSPV